MDTFLGPKRSKKFVCQKCNYYSNKYSQFERHLQTKKHNDTNDTNDDTRKGPYVCACGKTYKYHTGLSRHKKLCKNVQNVHFIENEKAPTSMIEYYKDDLKDMFIQLMEKNQVLMEKNEELMEKVTAVTKEPKVINNNTQFNVMNYLNNECKDAMDFTEFIDTFEFKVDDLHLLADKGYQETMEQTFIKQLKDMDKTKRPIHCSDKKRKSFYVKENGVWEKDDDNVKLFRGVKRIASRHFTTIHKWRTHNPDCFDDDRKHLFFHKAMSQVSKCDDEKHMKKVVNHLSGLGVKS